MKGQIKIVVSDWLYRRAKAMEKKFLRKYGTSLTTGSICGELEIVLLNGLIRR